MTNLTDLFNTPAWEDANCAGVSTEQADKLFFTPGFEPAAKIFCEGCPHARECLLTGEKFQVGVFGGVPPENRSTALTGGSTGIVGEHRPFPKNLPTLED